LPGYSSRVVFTECGSELLLDIFIFGGYGSLIILEPSGHRFFQVFLGVVSIF
jgi:hypothetical protein